MTSYSYTFGDVTFPSKASIKAHVKALLKGTHVNTDIEGADYVTLRSILDWHPDAKRKLCGGVVGIRVIKAPGVPNCKCFAIVRPYGDLETFSYRACFNGASTHRAKVVKAFREAIADQVFSEKQWHLKAYANNDGTVYSPVEQQNFKPKEMALDHWPVSFATLLEDFMAVMGYEFSAIEVTSDRIPRLTDDALLKDWQNYHQENACYRLISAKLNSNLGRHDA